MNSNKIFMLLTCNTSVKKHKTQNASFNVFIALIPPHPHLSVFPDCHVSCPLLTAREVTDILLVQSRMCITVKAWS